MLGLGLAIHARNKDKLAEETRIPARNRTLVLTLTMTLALTLTLNLSLTLALTPTLPLPLTPTLTPTRTRTQPRTPPLARIHARNGNRGARRSLEGTGLLAVASHGRVKSGRRAGQKAALLETTNQQVRVRVRVS